MMINYIVKLTVVILHLLAATILFHSFGFFAQQLTECNIVDIWNAAGINGVYNSIVPFIAGMVTTTFGGVVILDGMVKYIDKHNR